jgi:hypothetical protein
MGWLSKTARLLGVRGGFAPTVFVWSRGLALLCEHYGGRVFVREQRGGTGELSLPFDPRAYDNVREGDLVWVRLTALPQFIAQVLPRIRARFALVSGDEDRLMPSHLPAAQVILDNPYVVCWFTQNLDGTDASGKMLPLPIGIDFHTISNRRRWGHRRATPREQEKELQAVRATMPPNAKRLPRVHADFHFNRHEGAVSGETRAAVEAVLRRNPSVDFLEKKVPRLALWREKTRYAFVVSPRGGGLDCHRTWESLALDNIVIVKRSCLDALYQGLPVVIVDRWEDITEANLWRWHAQHAGSFAAPEMQQRLTNQYWIAQVRAVLAERLGHTPALPTVGLRSASGVGHAQGPSGETQFAARDQRVTDRDGAFDERDVPRALEDLHRNLHPIAGHDRHQETHVVDRSQDEEFPGPQAERGRP